MDQIHIENLEVFGHHGVYREENRLGQKFIVSAVLYLDLDRACKTDSLQDSVNYGEVCHLIQRLLQEKKYALLERAAQVLCEEVLFAYPLLYKVELELKKPWAPILLHLESVSVRLERKWHKVYIGLGSNMGDKQKYLEDAISALQERRDIRVKNVSNFYETKPYGPVEQDLFLNACVYIETLQSPTELLDFLHQIEAKAERERLIHWGPRTLDLDILLYDDLVIDSESLTIPHRELHKRSFVLDPLSEIGAYVRHPVKNCTIEQLRQELEKDED